MHIQFILHAHWELVPRKRVQFAGLNVASTLIGFRGKCKQKE